MNANIFILSGPVRSGKTSMLAEWVRLKKGISGVLTPDEKGRRMLLDIAPNKYHMFEAGDTYGGETVTVGRFLFARAAFEEGRRIIAESLDASPEWLVIDEAGKLEIEQGEGFEPFIKRAVQHYQRPGCQGRLILVVRDSLLEAALKKYNLHGCHILTGQLPL